MKSGNINKSRQLALIAGLFGVLFALSNCNKKVPIPATVETPPEEKLVEVVRQAEPVEIVVEDATPVIDKECAVSILGYHDFTENGSGTQMRIKASKFRQQMQAIKDAEIPVIPMRDYLAWRRGELQIPRQCIVITVDDGWREFHTYGLPILKEFGYSFIMYLYTNFLNNGGRSMSDQQVRDLLASNGEIGSHSVSHSLMTAKKGKSEEEYEAWLKKEIFESKKSLEERFNVKISSFAYPFGGYTEHIAELVAEAGYEIAVTVNGARANFDRPVSEIPRYIVHGDGDLNWSMATNFRGSEGLAKSNNLLKSVVDDEGNEVGEKPVKTFPSADEVIAERQPLIQVDLSSLEGVVVDSITMEVSGFGKVKPDFDAVSKVLSWQIPWKLRMKTTSVTVKLKRDGQTLPDLISWDFSIDRTGIYLNDQKEEKPVKKVVGMVESAEVRRGELVE
jgi:peptidoglycan/xylan/chitin deacetylase (PgdA/CDA1 family)